MSSIPRAFISYSWDDDVHRSWVRDFAARLRGDGVDVLLDRWHAVPGDQLPAFMETAVKEAGFVLIVCTPNYRQKSEARLGGVGYEGDVMTGEVLTRQNDRKFVPILRSGDWDTASPSWLKGKYYIDLRGTPYAEASYGDLLRTLHDARPIPPPIGPRPVFASDNTFEDGSLARTSSQDTLEQHRVKKDAFSLAKQFLSDPGASIQLHDLVMEHARRVVAETRNDLFPLQGVDFSVEELTRRLRICETATQDLRRVLACVAYWGTQVHSPILTRTLARVTDHLDCGDGFIVWIGLRWYPAMLLLYSSGIAALASGRYDNLRVLLNTRVGCRRVSSEYGVFALAIGDEIGRIEQSDAFKQLSGYEKCYVPRSEYLFGLLQPELDDDLFLGKEYELVFDRFEVLLALVNATIRMKNGDNAWGPVGRFGWKTRSRVPHENPLWSIIQEAKHEGKAWPPFKAGLFESDYDQMISSADAYMTRVFQLGWI